MLADTMAPVQLGDGTTTERHSPVQIMTGVQSFCWQVDIALF